MCFSFLGNTTTAAVYRVQGVIQIQNLQCAENKDIVQHKFFIAINLLFSKVSLKRLTNITISIKLVAIMKYR